jgi:hypothetical protein
VTLALSEGELVHTHAEMERAFQRQPEGPTKFQAPRHQQSTSPRPKPANNTVRVHRNDPTPQREQRLFGPHSDDAKFAARRRRDETTAILRDVNQGPCLTDDAVLYVAEIIPCLAIVCGQDMFRVVLDEWVAANTPRVPKAEVNEIVACVLTDQPLYTSPARGKRLGVKAHVARRRNKTVKDRRHAAGESKTRRELSIEQLKPWLLPEAPCNSRAAFYRLSEDVRDALIARARAEAIAGQ